MKRVFAASATGAAMLRTTTAPTIFQAGAKDNVLPSTARAMVNFRILSGDSTVGVIEHLRRTIDDSRIQVRPVEETATEPSPVSDVHSESFQDLNRTIREVFPGFVSTGYEIPVKKGRDKSVGE